MSDLPHDVSVVLNDGLLYLNRGNFKTGVCGCGQPMNNHKPKISPHTALDAGEQDVKGIINDVKRILTKYNVEEL